MGEGIGRRRARARRPAAAHLQEKADPTAGRVAPVQARARRAVQQRRDEARPERRPVHLGRFRRAVELREQQPLREQQRAVQRLRGDDAPLVLREQRRDQLELRARQRRVPRRPARDRDAALRAPERHVAAEPLRVQRLDRLGGRRRGKQREQADARERHRRRRAAVQRAKRRGRHEQSHRRAVRALAVDGGRAERRARALRPSAAGLELSEKRGAERGRAARDRLVRAERRREQLRQRRALGDGLGRDGRARAGEELVERQGLKAALHHPIERARDLPRVRLGRGGGGGRVGGRVGRGRARRARRARRAAEEERARRDQARELGGRRRGLQPASERVAGFVLLVGAKEDDHLEGLRARGQRSERASACE